MKILHSLLLLICSTVILSAQATTYYVSNAGSNSNTGTSEIDAFEDIQFAIDSASTGDTVLVIGGFYSENLVFSRSGIVLASSGIGSVELVSSGNPFLESGDTIITIVDQSDITISGFNIAGAFGAGATGVFIGGASQNIELLRDTIGFISTDFLSFTPSETESAYPINVVGEDGLTPVSGVVIDGNLLTNNGVGLGAEITVSGNVNGFTITDNEVIGSQNTGVRISSSGNQVQDGIISSNSLRSNVGDAISINGGSNSTIERNLILSNGGVAINLGSADNVTVRNNLISASGGSAIAVGDSTGTVANSTIRNNSTFNNGSDGLDAEVMVLSAENTSIINNIFSNLSGNILSASAGTGLILNYNLYFTAGTPSFDFDGSSYASLEDYSATTEQDTNSIYGDPAYQGTGQGALNFHLRMASPAIDAGDPNTMVGVDEVDAYGDLRVVRTIDIGANEFQGALPVTYLSPFKANLIDEVVHMDWHTAEEINSDHFEVQRSTDLEHWSTIVSMPSVGESHLYKAMDREPLAGTTYYRLMQVDLDGTTDLSHIEIISVNKSTETRIFPNPAASWLRIEAGIGATVSEVRIFDLTGKMIMRSFDEGTNVTVDLTQLSTGTYVVQYRTDEGVKATKIQKN